jgi:hypothetical protein
MPTPEEIKAAQDAAAAEALVAKAKADEEAAALAAGNPPVDPKVQELINQKRHANKEAVEAKKRADAAEAKLKAIEDAQKTEQQRIAEENTALKARLEVQEKANAQQTRINAALKAGAGSEYADLVAFKLESMGLDPNDVEAMDALKKSLPNLFGQAQRAPAPASAGGGPGNGSAAQQKKAAEIEAYKKAIAAERDDNQKLFLKRALRKLETSQA